MGCLCQGGCLWLTWGLSPRVHVLDSHQGGSVKEQDLQEAEARGQWLGDWRRALGLD